MNNKYIYIINNYIYLKKYIIDISDKNIWLFKFVLNI